MKAQKKSKAPQTPINQPPPSPVVPPPTPTEEVLVHDAHDRAADGDVRHRHRRRKPDPLDLSEEDRAAIEQIETMLSRQDREGWEVGDLTARLVDRAENPIALSVIKCMVGGRHKSTISRFHSSAKTVRSPEDRARISIYEAYDIYRTHAALRNLGFSLDDMVKMWANRKPESPKRTVRGFFLDEARNQRAQEQVRILSERAGQGDGRVFLGEWENVLAPVIEPGSVDLIVGDPPFGHYKRMENGGYSGRDGGNRRACLHNDSEGALRTTGALFEWASKALKPDGRLILFQAGTQPLRKQIQDAAARFGFLTDDELHWLKELVSPRDHEGCHGSGVTKVIVYRRKGAPMNDYTHRGLSNADILFCPSPSQRFVHRLRSGDVEVGEGHVFQAPIALMEYLLLLHCPARGLVVEPFGCTGSASLAAIKRGFDFRYCEAVEENFNEGSNRIHRALDGDQTVYSEDLPENIPEYVFPSSVAPVIELLKRFDARAQPSSEPASEEVLA